MFKLNNDEFNELPRWKKLRAQIIPESFPAFSRSFETLSYYDLVSVVVDENQVPSLQRQHPQDVPSYLAFTSPTYIQKIARGYSESEILTNQFDPTVATELHLKTYMLGDLIESVMENSDIQPIKINPVFWKKESEDFPFIVCEEVLFAPLFDKTTKKMMMTNPENALALLAIDPQDQSRFGIEVVFHALNPNDYSSETEIWQKQLLEELNKLAFYISRVPMRKGSGNFYCVLLNLENIVAERAFIRNYNCFESFISPVFVTSGLELLSGTMKSISYDGEKIDTIFGPLIQWQKSQEKSLPIK